MPPADLARRLPKAELHLHIEGTLEPELLFELAGRNGVRLRYGSVEELRAAYDFDGLQSFLDLYYEGAGVLRRDRDFYELAKAYFRRAAADGVRHAEIFFDPQTHTARGVPMGAVVEGLDAAMREARRSLGISSDLILCFLRHLDEEDAMRALEDARPYRERILGVGLDSSEKGHPPAKFERVFAAARADGLRAVAHAGEEGPAAYIAEALDRLGVERIDHGVRCLEDDELVKRLRGEGVPLTVCPISNVRLRVFDRLEDHNLKTLLAEGLKVSLHSDDPAYFGGYIGDNYEHAAKALDLSADELRRLARNSIESSFLPEPRKRELVSELSCDR